MFARTVSMRLKANAVADFNRTIENDVNPILRQRKGFQDEIVLVTPNGAEAIGISIWDSKESAEAYNRETYPQVQKFLSKVTEGTPQVQNYEVPISTLLQRSARGGSGA